MPGRSSCYALLFFLKHSSVRLMLRSDLQHVLDARLLGSSWSFSSPSTRSLGITRLGFSWNFQHALGALGTASVLLMLASCAMLLALELPTRS